MSGFFAEGNTPPMTSCSSSRENGRAPLPEPQVIACELAYGRAAHQLHVPFDFRAEPFVPAILLNTLTSSRSHSR
jgi:hypothetical protein